MASEHLILDARPKLHEGTLLLALAGWMDGGLVSTGTVRSLMDGRKLTDIRLIDYEGPSGFSTLLLAQAPKHGIEMMSLVAEIPGYLQGLNPLSIEAVTRRLSALLNLPVDFNRLRSASNDWEAQVSEAVEHDKKLAATVRRLEEQYDNELIGVAPPEEEEEEMGEEAEEEEEE